MHFTQVRFSWFDKEIKIHEKKSRWNPEEHFVQYGPSTQVSQLEIKEHGTQVLLTFLMKIEYDFQNQDTN